MIKIGYEYKVFNPKTVKGDKLFVFQLGDKGRDGKFRYLSFMCEMQDDYYTIEHGDKIQIDLINGASLSEFNGKYQVTLFGEFTRLASDELKYDEKSENEDGTTLDISPEDLPF